MGIKIKINNFNINHYPNSLSTNTSSQSQTSKAKLQKDAIQKDKIKRNSSNHLNQKETTTFKRKNQKADIISKMHPIKQKNIFNLLHLQRQNEVDQIQKQQNCLKKKEKTNLKRKIISPKLLKQNIEKQIHQIDLKEKKQENQNVKDELMNSTNLYVKNHLIFKEENNNKNYLNPSDLSKKTLRQNNLNINKQCKQKNCLSQQNSNRNSFSYYKIIGDYRRRTNSRTRSYSNGSNDSNKLKNNRINRILSVKEKSQSSLSKNSIHTINSQQFSKYFHFKNNKLNLKQSIRNRKPQSATLVQSCQKQLNIEEKFQNGKKDDPFSIYSYKVQKLEKQVSKYKQLYFDSLAQMRKMQYTQSQQRKKFQLQKQVLKNQVNGLKKKLQAKKEQVNGAIGHLYTYDQYNSSSDVNNCMNSSKMIPQEQNQSSLMLLTLTKGLENFHQENESRQISSNSQESSQHLKTCQMEDSQNMMNPSNSLNYNLSLNSNLTKIQQQLQYVQQNDQHFKEQKSIQKYEKKFKKRTQN